MATVTEEKFLATATVLTEEEARHLDEVLENDPEPVNAHLLEAFKMAAQIRAD